jgi:hypothetical protein
MTEPTIRLCIDCRHAKQDAGKSWRCHHPTCGAVSRVTGETVPSFCFDMRLKWSGSCGEIGTLWEAKP